MQDNIEKLVISIEKLIKISEKHAKEIEKINKINDRLSMIESRLRYLELNSEVFAESQILQHRNTFINEETGAEIDQINIKEIRENQHKRRQMKKDSK